MAVLFAGNESEAYNVASSTVIENTTGASFDSTYVRCSLQVGSSSSSSDYAEAILNATVSTTLWLHFEYYTGGNHVNTRNTLEIYDSSIVVFRLQTSGTGGTHQAQYWNGSSFTNIGSTFSLPNSGATRRRVDVKIVCGASGSFEVYVDDALVDSGSAIMTSVTGLVKFRWNCNSNAGQRVSQVIAADEPTVGWKFHTKPPTGNGANTAFTGAYTDVDETVRSDADFISSGTPNDVETFTGAALTLSGTVKAVVVSARIKNDGSSPVNAQMALRRGSTDYFSGNLAGVGASFGGFVHVWATDPAGGSWTSANAALSANEFGVKSIT